MTTDELREAFLDFFVSKGCVRRPSDVLAPKEDETVLFTPAGMNQFKREFMGLATRASPEPPPARNASGPATSRTSARPRGT